MPDRGPNHVLKVIADAYGKHDAFAETVARCSGSHLSNMIAHRKTVTWEQVEPWAQQVIEAVPVAKTEIAIAIALHRYGVVLQPAPERDGRGYLEHALEVAGTAGQVVSELRAALADGTVDEGERCRALAAVRRASKALGALDVELAGGK